MVTIYRAGGTILNPLADTPTFQQPPWTSDNFSGANGELVGRMSDAAFGGTSQKWLGAAATWAVQDGAIVPNSANFSFVGFAQPTPDMSIEIAPGFTASQNEVLMDLRRQDVSASSGPNGYRAGFGASGVSLRKRVAGTQTYLSGVIPVDYTKAVKVKIVGSVFTLLQGGAILAEVTDTAITLPGYVGLAYGGTTVASVPGITIRNES